MNSYKIFILLLIKLAYSSFIGQQPSVKIDLIHHLYFRCNIGEPYKNDRVMIDLYSDQITLSQSITSSSNYHESCITYSDSNNSSVVYGSDVFHFSNIPIRLPVIWNYDLKTIPSGIPSMTFHGVIGLGKNSPLWKYWKGYTLDAWSLILHSIDSNTYKKEHSLQWMDMITKSPKLYFSYENETEEEFENSGYEVKINQLSEMSLFPYEIKQNQDEKKNKIVWILHGNNNSSSSLCYEKVANLKDVIWTKNNEGIVTDKALFKKGQRFIQLGFWSLRYFRIHSDFIKNKWRIESAQFYIVNSENDCWFSVICSIVIVLLFGIWVLNSLSFYPKQSNDSFIKKGYCFFKTDTKQSLVSYNSKDNDLFSILIFYSSKLFALGWMILFLVLHLKCYKGKHLFEKYSGWEHNGLNESGYLVMWILLMIGSISDLIICMWSLVFLFYEYNQIYCGSGYFVSRVVDSITLYNKIIFEPVALGVIWLCLMGDSESSHLVLRNLLISILLLSLSLVNTMYAFCKRLWFAFWLAFSILLCTIVFLVLYNVSIYEKNYSVKRGFRADLIVSLTLGIFCLFMSVYLLENYHDTWILNSLKILDRKIKTM